MTWVLLILLLIAIASIWYVADRMEANTAATIASVKFAVERLGELHIDLRNEIQDLRHQCPILRRDDPRRQVDRLDDIVRSINGLGSDIQKVADQIRNPSGTPTDYPLDPPTNPKADDNFVPSFLR